MIGTLHFDRYQILEEIGRGGMGVIYRAHDQVLEREVAIKVLSAGEISADGRTRLLNEARSAAQLNHPNIVSIFDAGETVLDPISEIVPFVVMELVDGQSLYEQKPASIDQIVEIARQLASALAHAHSHGIIHRDIKPENVLIQPDGTVKLTDFGLARSFTSRLSSKGDIVGTVYYLAPEFALGGEYDGRADLYSLGVLLYELAAGELPFVADDPLAVISQHLHSPVVPPRARNPEIPISLENLIIALLSKQAENRPASAADLVNTLENLDWGVPGAEVEEFPLLNRIVRGRMVGRDLETVEARAFMIQALSGQATVLLISGEPGVGKTRFARELIAQARVRGSKILEGGCYEYEASTPYLPMAEALRDWIHDQDPEELRTTLGKTAAEVNRLAPEVEAKLGPIELNPPLSAQEERLRMYDSLARLLRNLAQDSGLVLFLDDLHWADRGTLSLLPYILRRLRSERFLILATYREVELDRQHPLSAALIEWNKERLASRITLGRLTYSNTVQLLEVLFDQPLVSDEFSEAIYRETEGNPFFIEEVIKSLVEQGKIYRVGNRWERDELDNLAIPQSIKEAVGRRLNQLDPFTVEILHMASVFGKDFPYSIFGSTYLDRENDTLDALEEAEKAQLIRPESGERFVFTHDKIREVLYEEQNAIRRRRTHIRLAEQLEKTSDAQIDDIVSELSYHYVQGGDLTRGFKFSMRAAEKSAIVFAYDEALKYYADALACIETFGSNQEIARIYDAIGDIYGQIGPVTDAIKNYERALENLTDPVDRARVLTKSGGLMITVGDLSGDRFVLNALDELDPKNHPYERAYALLYHGRFYHITAQYSKSLEIYYEALELAESVEDPLLVTELYAFIAGTYQHLTDFEESMKWAHKAIEFGERENYPFSVADGYEFLAEDLLMMGRYKESIAAAEQDRMIGEKIGSSLRVAWSGFSRAESLHGLGKLEKARALYQEVIEQAEVIGDRRLAILSGGYSVRVLSDLGQIEESLAVYERWKVEAEEVGEINLIYSCVFGALNIFIVQEKWAEAIEVVEKFFDTLTKTENRSGLLILSPERAAVYLGLGNITRAEEIATEAFEHALVADAPIHMAKAKRVLGGVASNQGRTATSETNYREALELLRMIGNPVEEGRTLEQRGIARFKSSETERGRGDLLEALALYRSTGAIADEHRIKNWMAEHLDG